MTARVATTKVRAEGRARQLAGTGDLEDVIDGPSLKRELASFYAAREGQQDVSPGLIALNRARRGFDSVSEACRGPDRVPKPVVRKLWTLLSEELVRRFNDTRHKQLNGPILATEHCLQTQRAGGNPASYAVLGESGC